MSFENYVDLFNCIMCGRCCKGYGGTYVGIKKILQISNFLETDCYSFILKYSKISNELFLLTQVDNKYCSFWSSTKGCMIHDVKPNMCRNWPFLQIILNNKTNWNMISTFCPGIKIKH